VYLSLTTLHSFVGLYSAASEFLERASAALDDGPVESRAPVDDALGQIDPSTQAVAALHTSAAEQPYVASLLPELVRG
jgi:hypothetical protein